MENATAEKLQSQKSSIFLKGSPQGERHIPLKSPNIIFQEAKRGCVREGVGWDPDSFTPGIVQL